MTMTQSPAHAEFESAREAAAGESRGLAIEARGLVKRFDGTLAVDGIDISVPEGSIFGILGPNGAGKTTTLRMLLGIIDPDEGTRLVLGSDDPHAIASRIGYLPEERGLYPSMKAVDAIAFIGSLRGLPKATGRERGRELLEAHGFGEIADRQIRRMSKGQAQTVQLLATLVHEPELVVLDEPFSGLDAISQGRLEVTIRELAAKGTTVIFSTHVLAHAERLCESIAIIAGGRVPFHGEVSVARDRLPPQVHLETRAADGAWRAAIPADASPQVNADGGALWNFSLPESGVEPLLIGLVEGGARIKTLSIERAGLHDAFVEIAGEAAARALEEGREMPS